MNVCAKPALSFRETLWRTFDCPNAGLTAPRIRTSGLSDLPGFPISTSLKTLR